MKELNHFVPGKGLFTMVKGQFFFTKGHSENPEGQVGGLTALNQKLFLKSLI